MSGHTHEGSALTFGCPGCIADAERARIDNAPRRLCVFHCQYLTFDDEGEGPWTKRITVPLKLKVPAGWSSEQVEGHYPNELGEAFVMALPESVPMHLTDHACHTMVVERVVIGAPIVEQHAPNWTQEALL